MALIVALILDILCALFFVVTAPFWIYKMIISRKYRAGWPQRLGFVPRREGDNPCIWIHGVSVGEILAARAIVRRIEERHPDWDVVLSTMTLDGHRVAERAYPGRLAFYFPMEFSFVIRRTFRRIRPTAVLLVEQDLWANFLHHAKEADIPVLLVNGRISQRSYSLYRFVRWHLFRPVHKIRRYCVQTREYADRFAALGIPRDQIIVTGSMKFDNIPTGAPDEEERREARRLLGIGEDEWVLIGGSTHAGEEEALLDIFGAIRKRRPRSRLVLVPRHMERIGQIIATLTERGESFRRKTDLDREGPGGEGGEVILVDTMGELPQIYPAATVVFVGGSLVPVGGHNMLEPAGLGLAVVIGPHVFKCAKDVGLLVDAEAGIRARDEKDLQDILLDLLDDPERVRALGERAEQTLVAYQGATDKIMEQLEEVLGVKPEALPVA
jgi:3-deoxy-D-manno-octulosonic-acid transferase